MKRYAVAYFSIFKGELKLEIVEAEDELSAAIKVLSQNGWDFEETPFESYDELMVAIEEMGDDWLDVKEV